MQPFTHKHIENTHAPRHSHTLTSAVCSITSVNLKQSYLFFAVLLFAISQIASLLHHSLILHDYCRSVPIILCFFYHIFLNSRHYLSCSYLSAQYLWFQIETQMFLAIFVQLITLLFYISFPPFLHWLYHFFVGQSALRPFLASLSQSNSSSFISDIP